MSIQYNTLNVDERYSAILEPNLYYNPILVPGVTCTDKYEVGPAGQIYVHKLSTSAVAAGTPGRDFTDEVASDTLIPIQLNNNFQKSKKIYGVQAAAVAFAAGNEYLATAIQECREGWMQCGVACLAQEAKAATATAAITADKVKDDLIDTRTEIVKDKGRANVVMCTPEFYGLVLKAAGRDFTPSTNDRIASSGNVGNWLGFTFVEANGAAGNKPLCAAHPQAATFQEALDALCQALAKEIVMDGEGVSKFVTVRVTGAETPHDAHLVARAIARSPLVKTSWFGRDPNWGRVLCAAGYSGAEVDPTKTRILYAGVCAYDCGKIADEATLAELSKRMEARAFDVDVELGLGNGAETVFTCDLTFEYVKINAEYTT